MIAYSSGILCEIINIIIFITAYIVIIVIAGEDNVEKKLKSRVFSSLNAKNEYRGDRNVGRKLLAVDGNDNFHRSPPLP